MSMHQQQPQQIIVAEVVHHFEHVIHLQVLMIEHRWKSAFMMDEHAIEFVFLFASSSSSYRLAFIFFFKTDDDDDDDEDDRNSDHLDLFLCLAFIHSIFLSLSLSLFFNFSALICPLLDESPAERIFSPVVISFCLNRSFSITFLPIDSFPENEHTHI